MDAMFIGEFSCKVDNKGRVMMPIKFREQLGSEEFVITRGLDNCINLFPIERWSEVEARLKELKMTNSKHRAYQRLYYQLPQNFLLIIKVDLVYLHL